VTTDVDPTNAALEPLGPKFVFVAIADECPILEIGAEHPRGRWFQHAVDPQSRNDVRSPAIGVHLEIGRKEQPRSN
jgi:hypothetical protein